MGRALTRAAPSLLRRRPAPLGTEAGAHAAQRFPGRAWNCGGTSRASATHIGSKARSTATARRQQAATASRAQAAALPDMAQFAAGADSYYVQDCRQVQNNTHGIQTLTGQISRKIGSASSDKDVVQCRGMVDDAVRQATETRAILARIREHQAQAQNAAERNNRRMMYQKLSDNLAITARVLEDVVRRFQAEEARRPRMRASDADAAGGEEQLIPLVDTGAGLGMSMLKSDALDEDVGGLRGLQLWRSSAATQLGC